MTANLQRLKRRALDFEQKKQFDRALELYQQFLDEAGRDLPDDDIPLFNRVGDLLVRRGEITESLGFYERAVDMYAERGFLNNAIALCSKILRQSPGRATVYYKLGKISARKGFKSDARKNFLEYADRMQKSGKLDEAFRALKEFAGLFPDQDDVRLMLADLLSRENRKGEALEQLQALHEKLESEGRGVEARATLDRMKAIDPDVKPRVSGVQVAQRGNALVFLDVTGGEPPPRREPTPSSTSVKSPPQGLAPALDGLRITFVPDEPAAEAATPEAPRPTKRRSRKAAPTPVDPDVPDELAPGPARATPATAPAVDGFEPTALVPEATDAADATEATDATAATDATTDSPEAERVDAIEDDTRDDGAAGQPDAEADASDPHPLSISEFAELQLNEIARPAPTRRHDLALPTALPHLGEKSPPPIDAPVTPIEAETVGADGGEVTPAAAVPPIEEYLQVPTAEIPIAGATEPRGDDEPPGAAAEDVRHPDRGEQTPSPGEETPPATEVPVRSSEGVGGGISGDPLAKALEEPTTDNPFAIPTTVEEASAIDLDDLLSTPPSFGQMTGEGASNFPPLAGLTPDSPPDGLAPLADLDALTEEGYALDPTIDTPGAGMPEVAAPGSRTPTPSATNLTRRETPRRVATPRSIVSLGGAEGHLRQRVELEPENWSLRRRLGEALLDTGDREGGLYELELALVGFEAEGNLERATETAEVIIRVLPGSVRHHQKRVEYAVRAKDRVRLIAAYLELADALFRTGASEKSVAVYARVAELDRENERAVFALATLAPERLLALRGNASRPGRWSDELAAIDDGGPLVRPSEDSETSARSEVPPPTPAAAEPEPAAPPAPEPPGLAAAPMPDEASPPETVAAPDDAVPPDEYAPREASRHVEAAAGPAIESIEAFAPDPDESPAAPGAETSERSSRSESEARAVPPHVDAVVETPAVFRAVADQPPGAMPPAPAAPPREPVAPRGADGDPSSFVDLGEWLRDAEPPRSTRMIVEDAKPTGDEAADFAEMLRRFKRGLAENVDAEDFAAHYDLGVAFKEMGLIDEAIAEFQKSLRGADHRVRSYEALGQCFVEKGQYPIAAALLQRAIETPGTDDQVLIGVLYLLGFACEHLGRHADALRYYQRVFAVDIEFRDIAQRVSSMEHLTK
ncbi:MAG TPA: tetratricopeptide repeat protein [Gemmatimonadaceae bacterium]|nr:tetratricopeptide repeat protein [Gemmatimonadaceae bacterium]